MGWRRALRQIEASNNRDRRETDRFKRAVQREHDSDLRALERTVEAAERKAKALDEAVRKDFLKAASIRYVEQAGFQLAPMTIEAEQLSLSLQYSVESAESNEYAFTPDGYVGDTWCIAALDLLISPNGLCVALKVEHFDPQYRIRLNWVKKSNPSSSLIYLVDPESNEYYYPQSTDLSGEVLPNRPRIGVVLFERPRAPTSTLELHLSGVKLCSARGAKEDLVFAYRSPTLASSISNSLRRPALRDEIMTEVNHWASGQYEAIQRQREQLLKKGFGCAGMIVFTGTLFVLGAAATRLF